MYISARNAYTEERCFQNISTFFLIIKKIKNSVNKECTILFKLEITYKLKYVVLIKKIYSTWVNLLH